MTGKKNVDLIKNNFRIIDLEGKRLINLINQVLDLTKLEAGKIEWQIGLFSIEELICQAIESVRILSEQKGLEIRTQIQEDLPNIKCDRDRIVQVLINLLSNSVNFTQEGNITCKAWQKDDKLLVSVIDTGCGIESREQRKVFDKFHQIID